MANKFFSFIWYLVKDTVGDVGEFFKYVTKEKTWVAIWAIFTIISLVADLVGKALGSIPNYHTTIFGLVCFLVFYITYQWRIFTQNRITEERKRYWGKDKMKSNKEERK